MSNSVVEGPGRGARRQTGDTEGRVLIVDDRPDKLMTLEVALAPLGREVVAVGSGREALRQLLQHEFAVVLLDVNMPGMDGFETARLIRQRPRNRQTPLIFITAYGDDIHSIQGYSLGAVDFMLSPVTPEVLRSKVGVFLALHERKLEVARQTRRLERQARQLQELTQASLAIHGAKSIDEMLQTAVDAARRILNVDQAEIVLSLEQAGFRNEKSAVSPPLQAGVPEAPLSVDARPARLRILPESQGPSEGVLSAPLRGRDGAVMGMFHVAGDVDARSLSEDEALLTQLAQMTTTAVENILFSEAREANRIKDEFLATLSHELRTPLSAVLGWSQLLRSGMLTEEETREALEIIERNGQMQHKLIEDLLDISRIVTGKMQLTLRPMSLADVIHAAVDVSLPAAQAKHVELQVLGLDANAAVHGDPDRLQQVFWNLLCNAVKFTPAEGSIQVRMEQKDDQVHVAVADTGEGISPEFLPYVFDRFRQADGSSSRRHGGLGIGLAIVRHVVELHGGTVRASSPGKGAGTTVEISLPRRLERIFPLEATSEEQSSAAHVSSARSGVPSATMN